MKSRESKKQGELKHSSIKQPNKNQSWFLLAGILLITIFVYSGATKNDWTNWDDTGYVLENDLIKNLQTNTISDFFTFSQVMGNYHPLTMLSLALDWKMYGEKAKGFHLTSIFFHLLNSCLVFLLIRMLLENQWAAAIVSLLFAIHPAHTESVAWVSERKDVLYVFFYLMSLCAYIIYSKSKTILSYLFCGFAFVLSLLSKGQAVTLPVVLILIDYLKQRKWEWKIIFEKIPFFLLALIFGILAIRAQSMNKSITEIPHYSVAEKIIFVTYSLVSYLYKSIFPLPLSAFYPYPLKSTAYGWLIWTSPFILLLACLLILFRFRKNRLVLFGMGFFFVNVFLILQILPVGAAIMADRYTYLSYIGLFILIAQGFVWLHKNSVSTTKKGFAIIILLLLFVFHASLAVDRIRIWKNSETLWRDTLMKYNYIPTAHNNLGSYYQKNNRPDEALIEFNETLHLQNDFPEAMSNRSVIFRNQRKLKESIDDCNNAIRLNPALLASYMNRGIAYSISGKFDSAYSDFLHILEKNPANFFAYGNLGNLFDMQGKLDSAINSYTKAIQINPAYYECYGNRARSYYKLNKLDKALNDINFAIQQNQTNGGLYGQRAEINVKRNDFIHALEDVTTAQQLGFEVNSAYVEMIRERIK